MGVPLFSVITPVYNNPVYVNTTIKSVLGQKCGDFEYIIVDDGSTDNTPEVLREWSKKDERIRVITQENQWVYASINNALSEAKGEYILLVNSDDYLDKDILGVAERKIEEYKHPDIIWTKVLVHEVDENQNVLVENIYDLDGRINKEEYYSTQAEVRSGFLELCEALIPQNPHNIYKREIMTKARFRNDIYGADHLFNASIIPYIETALLIKEISVYVLEYPNLLMNISEGKYYEYEHDMYTMITSRYLQVFNDWGMLDGNVKEYFYEKRLSDYSRELRNLNAYNCEYSLSEKVKIVMEKYLDYTLWQMALETDRIDELDRRTVFGLKNIFGDENLPDDDDYGFLNHLVLVDSGKAEPDLELISQIIIDPMNPFHIGKELLRKVSEAKDE